MSGVQVIEFRRLLVYNFCIVILCLTEFPAQEGAPGNGAPHFGGRGCQFNLEINDYLFLMAYDEYSSDNDPGPISSQKWIEATVDDLAKKYLPEK